MRRLPFIFLFFSMGLCSASAQSGHPGTPRDASRFQLFNSACSRTAQSSVRHVRKYSRAMACNGVAGSFYRCDPNTAYGWQMIGGAKC